MRRRRTLSLLCLVGSGGCLRLQGDSRRGTTASGGGATATADGEADGDGEPTDDTETAGEVTLTERWTEELNLERVWAENQGFFLQGNESVASAFPSGVKWTRETPGPHGNHGAAAFALNDSRAVFGISPDEGEGEDPDSAARFFAFNSASGERLWRYDMPTDGAHEYARGAAIVDDIAVIGSHLYGSEPEHDPLVVGVDAETGERVWETHLAEHGARYLSSMSVYDGSVCVGMAGSGVALLDPATGAVDRTFDSMRTLTVGGTVSGATFFGAFSGDVSAVGLDDGSVRWTGTVDDRTYTHPAVDNTLVVFGTGTGTVYAFERESGEVRWEQQVNGTVNTIALTASDVWVADRENGLTAFGRDGGAVRHRATEPVEDMAARSDSLLVGDDETTLYTVE